jgi:putative mRNA 3-end processing factor
MVKISFLGSVREIGKSAILVESEVTGDTILLDYGTKMSDPDNCFPEHVSGKKLRAIVLSHAHIDHSGALPLFYISGSVPLYCTELTYKITSILLKDMINISEVYLPFDKNEIEEMDEHVHFLEYRERKKITDNIYVTLYNSGHIPGAAITLVEMDGKNILYTSDINMVKTQLMEGCDTDIPEIDCLITESTYGTSNHDPRTEVEDKIITAVKKVITESGKVLIPAFGVSRSQELLMVLLRDGPLPFPVYMDGMARKVARIYLEHPNMFRDYPALENAIETVHMIVQKKRQMERNQVLNYPGVIIAPSGMLKGGTSRIYSSQLIEDPKSAIYLVSYQADDAPGKVLMDERKYIRKRRYGEPAPEVQEEGLEEDEIKVDVDVQVDHYDFTSHSGMDDLVKFAQIMHYRSDVKKVFCVHGDEEVMLSFVETLKNNGFDAYAPEKKQIFEI